MATHEMSFAKEIADQVCFLRDGVVWESGTANQVFDAPQRAETQSFLHRVN
jgi:polar amino acid transport system ATP-binding protein